MKELSSVALSVEESPIRVMFDLAATMEDVVSFTLGEPDVATPENIVRAAVEALERGETHYTANAGILPLRRAIADATLASHGLKYDPQGEVIVTVGGMQALMLSMRALLNPGDEALVSDPHWTNHPAQVRLCDARPVYVPVAEDCGFAMRASDIERAITPRTKLLLLNSPSNPLGAVYTRAQLAEIAEIVKAHDLYVLSDEVYSSFLYDGARFESVASAEGMRERTIVVGSFSKNYAMTGWRVGWALGPAPVIRVMVKLQEYFVACVNSAAQYGALEALTGSQRGAEDMRRTYAERRGMLLRELEGIRGLTVHAPKGTFYLFVNIEGSGMTSREFALDLLKKQRVIVSPGDAFGQEGRKYIRLSYATSAQNILEGTRRLRAYMDELLT